MNTLSSSYKFDNIELILTCLPITNDIFWPIINQLRCWECVKICSNQYFILEQELRCVFIEQTFLTVEVAVISKIEEGSNQGCMYYYKNWIPLCIMSLFQNKPLCLISGANCYHTWNLSLTKGQVLCTNICQHLEL